MVIIGKPCVFYWFTVENTGDETVYMQTFNSSEEPREGDVPVYVMAVPSGATFENNCGSNDAYLSSGLTVKASKSLSNLESVSGVLRLLAYGINDKAWVTEKDEMVFV